MGSTKKTTVKKPQGGHRDGAGRQRKERDLADFDSVADPPADPLERVAWAQAIVAIDLRRIVRGRADRTISQEIRASANVIIRGVPMERILRVEQNLSDYDEELKADHPDPVLRPSDDTTMPLSGDVREVRARHAAQRQVAIPDSEMPLSGPPARLRKPGAQP